MFKQKLTVAVLLAALVAPNAAWAQQNAAVAVAPQPTVAAAAASKPVYKAPDEIIAKIRDESMNRSQVLQTLSYLTDVIGPRLTNSPGMKRANEWTRDQMTKWGLQNSKLEAWGPFGRGWTLKSFSATVVDPQTIPLIAYPKAWSPGTNGAVTADVVYLDAKTDADLEKYKGQLKGKIVLISDLRELKADFKGLGTRRTDDELATMAAYDPTTATQRPSAGQPTPEQIQRYMQRFVVGAKRMNLLVQEGAAMLVDNSSPGENGAVFVAGAAVAQEVPADPMQMRGMTRIQPYQKEAESKMIPQMTMATEHYNRLVRMIKAGEKPKMTVELAVQYQDQDLMGYNTVAEIPGSDPNLKSEVVMLGGHMDSWHSGTGATDNAAGVAVAMEAARIIQTLGLKPRRTIRVALWSGEEQGLHGSREYVKQHFGEMQNGNQMAAMMGGAAPAGTLVKKPDYEKLSVYYNLDNGTGKIRGVYLQNNPAVKPIFEAWLAPFKDLGASTVTLNNTGGTDHLAFDGIGLPGFQFIQDEIEYNTLTHHSNQDVFDRIQADDMKQASAVMAAFVYQSAMMDEKIPRKEAKK